MKNEKEPPNPRRGNKASPWGGREGLFLTHNL